MGNIADNTQAEASFPYDFVDFGPSEGGSMEFAKNTLGGINGLGVDNNPEKIEKLRKLGYECLELDFQNLTLPANAVRFSTLIHVLEHLPNLKVIKETLACAAKISTDFLYIVGPYFDADKILQQNELKFFWSDWSGHKMHVTTDNVKEVLLDLSLNDYVIMGRKAVVASDDASILPLGAPTDQHEYQEKLHGTKPLVTFKKPLFREIVCCVQLRPLKDWNRIVNALDWSQILDVNWSC